MGRLFGLAGAVGASLLVLAAPAVANDWRPIGSGAVATVDYVTGGGRRVSVDFRAPPAVAGGDARHIGRIIDVSPASVRALSRQALRYAGPAGLAVSVGMSAYDLWFEDDDIYRMAEGEDFGVVAGYSWRAAGNNPCWVQLRQATGDAYYPSYGQAVAAYAAVYPNVAVSCMPDTAPPWERVWGEPPVAFLSAPPYTTLKSYEILFEFTFCIYNSGTSVPCTPSKGASPGSDRHKVIIQPYEVEPTDTYPIPGTGVPADAQLVDEAIPDKVLAQVISEAIRNGYAVDAWTELAAAIAELNDILDSESANYDAALDAQTIEGTTVVQAGQQTGQQTASSGGMSGEWPGFCSWATIVCTLADWVMGESVPPDDPDLPVVEVETYDVITVGGGSYSCPSPTSLGSALGQPLVFSWDTACDFSVAAKPVVLLGSLLAAALVLVGVRQTGGGV